MANEAQLYLLVDHIKLILLEIESAADDSPDIVYLIREASRSLLSLKQSLDNIGSATTAISSQNISDLHKQYRQLHQQFFDLSHISQDAQASQPSFHEELITRNGQPDPSWPSSDATRRSSNTRDAPKFVRFSDTLSDSGEGRDALLPYRDDPDLAPDQSSLGNQQIHAYHGQVLQAQDRQLDELGQSVTRQREMSIQMGDELDEQGVMLDQMDEYASRHQTQLDRARDRLGKFARRARDNLQITTIIVLIIILVLLIVILK